MLKQIALSATLLLAPAGFVFAQGPQQGPQGDMRQRGDITLDRMRGGHGEDRMHERGMMHEWWRNPEAAQRVGLSPDQVKKLDDIVLQSRIQLIRMHASLEEEQLKLEPLMNANPIDQRGAMAQIDKIADTRAGLEKANAKMLLDERAVLSADQWTKLQEGHREMMRGGMRGNTQGGMRGGPGSLQIAPPSAPTAR